MKICPKSFRLFIFVFLILHPILFISPVFAQYFTIDKFHADITILEARVLLGAVVGMAAAEAGKGFFGYFA